MRKRERGRASTERVVGVGGIQHELDVYYEFEHAGVVHKVAVECKDTRKPIELQAVKTFHATMLDLPSTVGIFISRGGYQSGAKKYLELHGILHFDGRTMPSRGLAWASILASAALPTDRSIGQPFWGLMRLVGGRETGSWLRVPVRDPQTGASISVFPLFFSRPKAESFQDAWPTDSTEMAIRGLPQRVLRFVTTWAGYEGITFAVFEPRRLDGRLQFEAETISASDLASQFLPEGST